jgi:hypothetical protein
VPLDANVGAASDVVSFLFFIFRWPYESVAVVMSVGSLAVGAVAVVWQSRTYCGLAEVAVRVGRGDEAVRQECAVAVVGPRVLGHGAGSAVDVLLGPVAVGSAAVPVVCGAGPGASVAMCVEVGACAFGAVRVEAVNGAPFYHAIVDGHANHEIELNRGDQINLL